MRIQRVKFFSFVLILVVTLATFQGAVNAQETAAPSSKEAAGPETGSSLTISDLISFSTELSARLSTLQRNMEIGLDLPGFEKDLEKTKEQLKVLSARLKEMKSDGRLGYERLSALKAEMVASAKELEKTWKPFSRISMSRVPINFLSRLSDRSVSYLQHRASAAATTSTSDGNISPAAGPSGW